MQPKPKHNRGSSQRPVLTIMAAKKRKPKQSREPDKDLGSILKKISEESEKIAGVEKLAFEQLKKKSKSQGG